MIRGERPDIVANVRLTGAGRLDPFGDDVVDVHLANGVIADIAPAGALARRGAVVDGEGSWIIPGLWDHHVHTVQWALVAQREDLGPTASAASAAAAMGQAPMLADGRIRLSPETRIPFDEVRRAHEQLTSGDNMGKIVLMH